MPTDTEKIIYKASVSNWNFIQSTFLRLILLAALVYLVYNFNQNPPVIIIAGLFCLTFLLSYGNDEITVYSDRIVHRYISVAGLLRGRKEKAFPLADIKSASLPEQEKIGTADIAVAAFFAAFLRPAGQRRIRKWEFFLEMKNDKTVAVSSDLGARKISEIVQAVNSLIQGNKQ